MPRATGSDLAEIFGYAPDDTTTPARKQWKSQICPFVGNACIKHSHAAENAEVQVYGTCSVLNRPAGVIEEIIICPQRLYAKRYETLERCAKDAYGTDVPIFTVNEYRSLAQRRQLPEIVAVLFGQNSGGEISVAKQGVIELSLDWVIAILRRGKIEMALPCEVQSIDTTGNYRANWRAYSEELSIVPNSGHGMNWANVWKRLIPQLIMKSKIASTSKYCCSGSYFVLPDRVYQQFEKLVGDISLSSTPSVGTMTVFTYSLGPQVDHGSIRELILTRKLCFSTVDFAEAFASGRTLPLGSVLDSKIERAVAALSSPFAL
jgi:hypothetical protein